MPTTRARARARTTRGVDTETKRCFLEKGNIYFSQLSVVPTELFVITSVVVKEIHKP